jgi:small conductance mechanosensitive channel
MNLFASLIHDLDPEWKLFATQGLRIVLILALAWVLQIVAAKLIRAFRRVMARRLGSEDEKRRIETLGRVFRYVASVIIAIVAGTLVLGELGISVAPILATAGVAGVAIGFGAQSLIKDYFNGFFLLVEDQIRQGDVVQIADRAGVVEVVTLRYVRLRDFEGHVHFVPNGEIKIVTNRTREFAHAVIEVGVAYREDVDEALGVMREVGQALRADPAFGARILEDTEIIGVERWGDSAVILRCRLKVQPLEQWAVRREFLKRLKEAYDERGIEIPFPHLTVYAGQAKDGSAPALRVVSETR